MPTRRFNLVTERAGVNYVRTVVEECNSIFKEHDLRADYGHDAFVLIVDGEKVTSTEIAMQIKAGVSYCTPKTCRFQATGGQLTFWAGHNLTTLGVVYDPSEKVAFWMNLKAEAQSLTRGRREQKGATIEFAKTAWNRLDQKLFAEFMVPVLRNRTPTIDMHTALEWARSDDFETHNIGVRVLAIRHRDEIASWQELFRLFHDREADQLSVNVPLSFVQIIGHPDNWGHGAQAPEAVISFVKERVGKFGTKELAKLMLYFDENDLERGSLGSSLMALLAISPECLKLFAQVRDNNFPKEARQTAGSLIEYADGDPSCYQFWYWNFDPKKYEYPYE